MISIQNLTKVYQKGGQTVKALDGVSLEIEAGDRYGIIGLSGAGKSSLVRCINRLEEPTSGDLQIDGIDILRLEGAALRQARQGIGMIFQNFNLLSSKTIYENIAFPLRLQKLPEAQIRARVNELLEKVELTDKANVYPINLSGGQKQRVGIARALANHPKILLCDEATSALDPKTTKQILDLLKRINEELGVTLVVITHEMEVIKSLCNKVAILESGKVVESGETLQVFSNPASVETKHFIDTTSLPSRPSGAGHWLNLTFSKGSAKMPILSQIIRKHDIDINILAGTIETIQNEPLGRLLVEIDTSEATLKSVIAALEIQHVQTEVIA